MAGYGLYAARLTSVLILREVRCYVASQVEGVEVDLSGFLATVTVNVE